MLRPSRAWTSHGARHTAPQAPECPGPRMQSPESPSGRAGWGRTGLGLGGALLAAEQQWGWGE